MKSPHAFIAIWLSCAFLIRSSRNFLRHQDCRSALSDRRRHIESRLGLLLALLRHRQDWLTDFQLYVCTLHDGAAWAPSHRRQNDWVRWIADVLIEFLKINICLDGWLSCHPSKRSPSRTSRTSTQFPASSRRTIASKSSRTFTISLKSCSTFARK